VQADLEFVERSFADEEQYSEQDYKHGAAQVEEQAEPQGDAQQVEEGGSGTWLHAGATKHRAKVAVHKDQVATALRQRKADAVATPKVAVDPDIAQEAQLEERVERADAAAATEGSIVCTRMDTRSGRIAGAPSDSPLRTFKI